MATYKVLQDIEAEDKLFGPLTLKQFIFGGIAIVIIFILFQVLTSPLPVFIKAPVVMAFLPPLLVFGFLAAPIGRDQPNDVWLLARLRFLFKPRTRIWSQDGMSELVTITAPKRDTHVYTNNLSQTEVKSRLSALANTVDSRGWAVKNVNTNLFAQPGYLSVVGDSDRLVGALDLPADTTVVNVTAADDIMDPVNNSTAQHLDNLIQQSTASVKQHAMAQMQNPQPQARAGQTPAAPQDYWFMNQPQVPQAALPGDYATFNGSQLVQPGTADAVASVQATAEEEALAHRIAEENRERLTNTIDHMKVINPLGSTPTVTSPMPVAPSQPAPALTPVPAKTIDASVVQQLSQNNDLDVATIARQAKQAEVKDDGEVVISLH